MGLGIFFFRIESKIAAKTEYEIVLECFCKVKMNLRLRQKLNRHRIILRSGNEIAAKTEFGIVLEYFCEVRMKLRLRHKLELS